MKDHSKFIHSLRILGIVLISVVACIQVYLTVNNYIRLWRMPIWRLRNESSFNRSAVFFFSPEGADFLRFLNSILPSGVKVVPAEYSGGFSTQSILQFFMLDKTIMVCPGGEAGIMCLSKPDKYLIATTAYPPHESDIDKTFIPYPNADADYPYEGIYVPRDYIEGSYSAVYPETYNIPLTLLCDLGILLAWFLLGWLIISIILREPTHPLAFIAGFPIGMGIFTWMLFIISLLGAPLTLWTVSITYTGLLLVALFLARRLIRSLRIPKPSLSRLNAVIKNTKFNPLSLVLCALLGFLLLSIIYIGVGRGYSTFDDMVIWSLKGYYMAFKHDLFVASEASGHGLSYPLNLSLAISTFYLIDQDLLPGSKITYILLFFSMLACVYWFLRKNNIPWLLSGLGLLLIISTPVIFEYATSGFANIPFTSYLVIGTLLSIMGVFQNRSRFLYAGGLALSLAGWTRPEGIGFALSLACVIGIFYLRQRKEFHKMIIYLLLTLSLCGTWILLGYQHFQQDEIGFAVKAVVQAISDGTFSWSSVLFTINYALSQFAKINLWGLVVPISVLFLIVFSPVAIRRKMVIALAIALASLATYLIPLGMFVTKYYQVQDGYMEFLSTSFDRAQFPAVILLILALILVIGNLQETARME
jgi:hypothetical protein